VRTELELEVSSMVGSEINHKCLPASSLIAIGRRGVHIISFCSKPSVIPAGKSLTVGFLRNLIKWKKPELNQDAEMQH
jgi:hypothetical protein